MPHKPRLTRHPKRKLPCINVRSCGRSHRSYRESIASRLIVSFTSQRVPASRATPTPAKNSLVSVRLGSGRDSRSAAIGGQAFSHFAACRTMILSVEWLAVAWRAPGVYRIRHPVQTFPKQASSHGCFGLTIFYRVGVVDTISTMITCLYVVGLSLIRRLIFWR